MWPWPWSAQAQESKFPSTNGDQYQGITFPFENLVLKGGGAKGIAYMGACKVLQDAGILKNIKRFAGTSAGAITATLLAIGMPPEEMLNELSKRNLMDLLDPPVKKSWFSFLGRLPHVPLTPQWLTVDGVSMALSALTERGVCEGEEFLNWFGDILERNLKKYHPDKKGLNKDLTFDQLYRELDKELCVVAYNMVFSSETYFHVKTTPLTKIRDAVRMSMSLPVIFKPYEGNTGFSFVDGGLAANYPLWAFDGWYLSMETEDSFEDKLMQKDGDSIQRMFHPEYRSERFGPDNNTKTLGILMFSSTSREKYQEQFQKRLDLVDHIEAEETDLYKKYKTQEKEQNNAKDFSIKHLERMIGEKTNELIRSVKQNPDRDDAQALFFELIQESDLKMLNVSSKQEAFQMMMIDNNGEVTADKLMNICKNFGPLQLVKRRCLCHRFIKTPSQYYSAMLEFFGGKSEISEEDIKRSMAIDVGYVDTMDFGMTPQDMDFLIKRGVAGAEAFLCEWKMNNMDQDGPSDPKKRRVQKYRK